MDQVPVDLVVADVSFISLTLLVAPLTGVTAADGQLLLLVKPQFEVGRERLSPGGVVRDDGLRREAVDRVVAAAEDSAGPRRGGSEPDPGSPAIWSSSCCSAPAGDAAGDA